MRAEGYTLLHPTTYDSFGCCRPPDQYALRQASEGTEEGCCRQLIVAGCCRQLLNLSFRGQNLHGVEFSLNYALIRLVFKFIVDLNIDLLFSLRHVRILHDTSDWPRGTNGCSITRSRRGLLATHFHSYHLIRFYNYLYCTNHTCRRGICLHEMYFRFSKPIIHIYFRFLKPIHIFELVLPLIEIFSDTNELIELDEKYFSSKLTWTARRISFIVFNMFSTVYMPVTVCRSVKVWRHLIWQSVLDCSSPLDYRQLQNYIHSIYPAILNSEL